MSRNKNTIIHIGWEYGPNQSVIDIHTLKNEKKERRTEAQRVGGRKRGKIGEREKRRQRRMEKRYNIHISCGY